jgi:hypothetical protein
MTLIPSQSWSEVSPAGSDNVSAGDNRIREMKTQIREVIDVDHDFPSSGQAADVGQHKKVTLQEQANLGTGAVNATILGSQTVNGKGELVYTDEDDNDVQITSGGTLYMTDILNKIYPVGSVVTLGVSTNPGTLYGVGTWTAIEGKVIVGISDEAGDTAFNTLNKTGGTQTVTLTSAQSGLVAHTHTMNFSGTETGTGFVNAGSVTTHADSSIVGTTNANSAANAAEAHTNLQPYIVKYVWERIS